MEGLVDVTIVINFKGKCFFSVWIVALDVAKNIFVSNLEIFKPQKIWEANKVLY